MSRAPVLVIGYGNPGRGDDALGPALVTELERRLPSRPGWPGVELLMDMQLQVEHSLALEGRELVLFADANAALELPCALVCVESRRDASYTSHVLSPAALLHAYGQALRGRPPASFLLALRAERFELGAPLSLPALGSLAAGLDLTERLLAEPSAVAWRALCSQPAPAPAATPA